MVTYSKLTINAVAYTDAVSIKVMNNVDTGTNSFEAQFKNTSGRYDDSFVIGHDVQIFHDDVSPATVMVFRGVVEIIDPTSLANNEVIIVRGRDYSARLMDVTARETYSNTEVSVIVKDLIDKYITGITYTNVATTARTLQRMTFRHKSVFECIQQLADIAGYTFYIDTNKDLHFELEENTSSGYTLNNTNVKKARFITNDQEMYNQIWVYGDRYLVGFKDTFTGDGGSVFTTTYQPNNTTVTLYGVVQQGTVFNNAISPASGNKYAVDFENLKIIMLSGTNYGNNIPVVGSTLTVDAFRSLPVVKVVRDVSSVTAYGVREKVIINHDIKDPQQAVDIAKAELAENKDPKKEGNIDLQSSTITSLTTGNTVVVDLPYQNVNSETFKIIGVTYNINTRTLRENTVITLKLSQKIKETTDLLKQLLLDVKALQASEISTTDLLTRLESFTGSIGIKNFSWKINTRTLGSSFVLGHSGLGYLGSPITPIQPFLGDHKTSYALQYSGGTF